MSRSLGIPVKLLHEAAGHVVTVELKTGEVYRGSMVECEDNWNCQLENITFTAKVCSLCPRYLRIWARSPWILLPWVFFLLSIDQSAGWEGFAAGARLHQRKQSEVTGKLDLFRDAQCCWLRRPNFFFWVCGFCCCYVADLWLYQICSRTLPCSSAWKRGLGFVTDHSLPCTA